MHQNAKDFGRPSLAGNIMWKRFARPYLCGRSARLGTIPARPKSANIGSATTGSHLVEKKNKEGSRASSWKICSQPQTLSTLRMTVPATSTPATTTGITNHNRLTTYFPSDNSLRSRTFDSSTTNSDHWGLIAAIKSKHGKTPRKNPVRKPIGWECRTASGTTKWCELPSMWMIDILLRGHSTVMKALSHCMTSLMVPRGKFRAKKRVQAVVSRP